MRFRHDFSEHVHQILASRSTDQNGFGFTICSQITKITFAKKSHSRGDCHIFAPNSGDRDPDFTQEPQSYLFD
jgi:hypothetical protein